MKVTRTIERIGQYWLVTEIEAGRIRAKFEIPEGGLEGLLEGIIETPVEEKWIIAPVFEAAAEMRGC